MGAQEPKGGHKGRPYASLRGTAITSIAQAIPEEHMNIREVPQPTAPAPASGGGKGAGRYGIDPYLDWLKAEGIPLDRGLWRLSVRRPDRALAALWRQRRGGAPEGPRRLRQHVRVRDRARQIDDAAAASLRGSRLRARRPRLDPARIPRRQPPQLRVGRKEPVRHSAQRQAPAFQRQRYRARAAGRAPPTCRW